MPTLQFKGKTVIETYHHTVPHHRLELVPELSVLEKGQKPSLDGNLIIEGDNLLALKALLPTHAGRVKCIYIDPPYNTGEEGWLYNDNVSAPIFKDWIGKVVGKEEEDTCRHDKWCCMMYPRLRLLRDLLHESGVLFVSIDETEAGALRLLLDEIFLVERPLATLVWKRRSPTGMRDDPVSVDHEYVLVYAKDQEKVLLTGLVMTEEDYPYQDERGRFASTDLTIGMTEEERPNQAYTITNPRTKKKYPHNPDRVWRFEPDAMREVIEKELVIWPDEQQGRMERPRYKTYFDPQNPKMKPVSSWIEAAAKRQNGEPKNGDEEDEVHSISSGLNSEGGRALRKIMGTKVFNYPKPPSLIKSLLQIAASDGEIILDSFAGSGTTAQAALELSVADGRQRKFILVQMPWDNEKQREENRNVCETVTAERVKRVIKGYKVKNGKNQNTVAGTGGSFTYARVGEPLFDEYKRWSEAMPSWEDLAKYIFYTETSRQVDLKKLDPENHFVGATEAGGGTSYYLHYTPDRSASEPVRTKQLKELLKRDKRKNWVIYCEKIWVHQDDLAIFQRDNNKRIRFMQVPFQMK